MQVNYCTVHITTTNSPQCIRKILLVLKVQVKSGLKCYCKPNNWLHKICPINYKNSSKHSKKYHHYHNIRLTVTTLNTIAQPYLLIQVCTSKIVNDINCTCVMSFITTQPQFHNYQLQKIW